MNAWKLQNTHLQSTITAPNKTDFYQQAFANGSIYRNGLVARNGSVYKIFSDFYHLTVVNARMYR
jgi:hypothetical protein